jgi:hypothetical protein
LVWDKTLPFPLNNSWGYHDAATGNGKYDEYYKNMVKRYGEPVSMEDFSNKMQLMNATGYQGIFEAAGHKLNDISGVMLWKLNAAFPSVVWQVFDWYLEPNAGYYFMQNACEPVHIQLNALDYTITAVNRSYHLYPNLTLQADVYDLDSKLLSHQMANVNLSSTEVLEPISLSKDLVDTKGVKFVDLNMKNDAGKRISHNVYWISSDNDFKALNAMPKTNIQTSVLKTEKGKTETTWTMKFTNNTKKLAFFIRPQLMSDGQEILPCYWSANYFSLAPGESITVKVSCSTNLLKDNKQEILLEGWNIDKQLILLNAQVN